jgi:hypothetical protein
VNWFYQNLTRPTTAPAMQALALITALAERAEGELARRDLPKRQADRGLRRTARAQRRRGSFWFLAV